MRSFVFFPVYMVAARTEVLICGQLRAGWLGSTRQRLVPSPGALTEREVGGGQWLLKGYRCLGGPGVAKTVARHLFIFFDSHHQKHEPSTNLASFGRYDFLKPVKNTGFYPKIDQVVLQKVAKTQGFYQILSSFCLKFRLKLGVFAASVTYRTYKHMKKAEF